MKALSHSYLVWLAISSLHAQVTNADIGSYFRSKEYSEGTLGAWPHQTYRSSPAIGPLLNIQKDHPTCHDNKDHLLLMGPWGTEVSNPGPMILDTYGGLVWNDPVRYGKTWAVDVRFLDDEPYLSFWASKDPASEVGHWYMLNSTYDEVYQIRSGDGWTADDHDFDITPKGTALLVVNKDIPFDLSPVGGPRHGWLRDNGIQEIDIATGEVLFQWTVASHYKLEEGYHAFTPGWGEDSDHPFEPFVLNSAHADSHGNYLVSIRHMSSIAYIDGQTGDVVWKLGGEKNSFANLLPVGDHDDDHNATVFDGQHHARILETGELIDSDTLIMTIFDNGFGAQEPAHPTMGKIVKLNVKQMTAQLLYQPYQNKHQTAITHARGSLQILPNGNRLLGYGTVPSWSEFTTDGRLLCDIHYAPKVGFNTQEAFSYRVLRRLWIGQPREAPSAVIGEDNRLYVSWNGATKVVSWELQASRRNSADGGEQVFVSIENITKTGFETLINIPEALDNHYLRVVGKDTQGKALGISGVVERPSLIPRPIQFVQDQIRMM